MEKAILIEKRDEDRFTFKCPHCNCQFHHIRNPLCGPFRIIQCHQCTEKLIFSYSDLSVLSVDKNKYMTECPHCETTLRWRSKKGELIRSLECPECREIFTFRDDSKTPFTNQEEKIWDHLSEAWNLFCKLQKTHPSHDFDFCNGIHQSQRVLEHKLLQRLYPETFRTYEVKDHDCS